MISIIRLIKLKELNNELSLLNDDEKEFLSIFNSMREIKLGSDLLYCDSNLGKSYFRCDFDKQVFWFSYTNVSIRLKSSRHHQTFLIKNLIENFLHLKGNCPNPIVWTVKSY